MSIEGLKNTIRKFLEKYKIKIDQRIGVFSFFLLISTVFWFLLALSKEYSTDLYYPVYYNNLPKGRIISDNLPDQLVIKATAFGNDILRQKVQTVSPITINFENLNLKNFSKDSNNIFLPTNQIRQSIEDQIGKSFSIIDIKPDTLLFEFIYITSKKVPIIPDISTSFEKQFMQKGPIRCKPDSITIFGPSSIVDTVDQIKTKHLIFTDLNETQALQLELKKIKGIDFSPPLTLLTIPVEEFTEKVFKIHLTVDNLPDHVVLRTFPNYIKINCLVGLSDYDRIHANQFQVKADYKTIENKPSNKLRVKIEKSPRLLYDMQYYPKSVEYIIENK